LGWRPSYALRCTTVTTTVSAFSDESWGGDPDALNTTANLTLVFQHSLMNLGVETLIVVGGGALILNVSAFSDESWGGDPTQKAKSIYQAARFSIL